MTKDKIDLTAMILFVAFVLSIVSMAINVAAIMSW